MIQTHIASISISKTEQKACCTLYPHIKKELDSEYKTDTIIFSFFVITRHFSLQYTKDKWVTCDDKAHRQ